ncbi:MAG: class I SAM-dependent methyltransferase [Cystobacterineae bacterium]|nr:class I SAM-dependent methyltransferase [Cystobacterineae bacterium]
MRANNEKARAYWERNAKRYDASLRITVGAMPKLVEVLKEEFVGAGRILELAAGTGVATEALAQVAQEVVAVDYAAAMVEQLKARVEQAGLKHVRCLQADIYALEFEPESFDAVVACNVLHLLPDLPKAYAAMLRMLKPGGRLVVPTVCQNETLAARLTSRLLMLTGLPAQRCFTVASLRASLEKAGLRVVKEKVFPGLMPLAYGVYTRK